MPSECIQALSPELSDTKSPESLYLKDDGLVGDKTLGSVGTFLTFNVPIDSSHALTSDVVNLKQEKNNVVPTSFTDTFQQNFDSIFGKLDQSNLECLRSEATYDSTDVSPDSTLLSPGSLSPTTPLDSYMDTSTQMSLCERSEALELQDALASLDPAVINDIVNEVSQSLPSPPINIETPRKVRKSSEMSDAPNEAASQAISSPAPFDAGAAVSSPQFIFTQFGKDICSTSGDSAASTSTSNILTTRTIPTPVAVETKALELDALNVTMPTQRKLKEPSLNMTFPAKSQGLELKVLVQPEDNHRARYMTEGSRGAVKDKKQDAFPMVKLFGCTRECVNLQVYIGNDTGKLKPHGFYQACKVCGKTASQCQEADIEGTTVIEIPLQAKDDYTARIDCVGILKLRNADVEKRIGLARSKKKSTKVRLVFRVNVPKVDGTYHTLQVASQQISCTQPAGQPEICKKSLTEASVKGGEELFIIGKNFMKGTKVIFQQVKDGKVVWKDQGILDMEFFQPSHLICELPPYKDRHITKPVDAQILIQSSGRTSDPHMFTFTPDFPAGG